MKKILVLSFMYEDPLVLKEFELLKEHYNKIIDYFCFPIKYYGVRATEEGETRIDEENQIIWLHTDDLKEYDKCLSYKVYDCFKFIEKNNVDYDIIIKGNTSTYLNLILLNTLLQHRNDDAIFAGVITYTTNNPTIKRYGRGNCLCLSKLHIRTIVNFNVNDIISKMIADMPHQKDAVKAMDDVMLSYMLLEFNVYQASMLTFGYFYKFNIIDDIKDVLEVGCVGCKIYNIEYNGEDITMNPSVILLNLIISFIEKHYIFDIKPMATVEEFQY